MDWSMDTELAALTAMTAADDVWGLHPLYFIVGVLASVALVVWLFRRGR